MVGAVCVANGEPEVTRRAKRRCATTNKHGYVGRVQPLPHRIEGSAGGHPRARLTGYFWLALRALEDRKYALVGTHASRVLEFDGGHVGGRTLRDAAAMILSWEEGRRLGPVPLTQDERAQKIPPPTPEFRSRHLVAQMLVRVGTEAYGKREYERAQRLADRALQWEPGDEAAERLGRLAKRAERDRARPRIEEALKGDWREVLKEIQANASAETKRLQHPD